MSGFTVDYFIEKFSAIPEEKWCRGQCLDSSGRRCAIGFCGPTHLYGRYDIDWPEAAALIRLFSGTDFRDDAVIIINDATGSSPKANILRALHEIKSEQPPA